MKRFLGFAAGFLLVGTVLAQPANVSVATAANSQWGQHLITRADGTATPFQFWFRVQTVAGRSYCVDTGNMEGEQYGDQSADTVLDVFQADGTTLIVHNDDLTNEPLAFHYSRACWIPSVAQEGTTYVKLTPAGVTTVADVTIRFAETTLYCPWFFVAGDYNAFSLIRNTSNTTLNGVVVTWRGLNGTAAGTTTVSIPANGTAVLNARDFVNPVTFPNGSIEIAHTGSLDQLGGSTTTLSGTTGLGFDALFTQRKAF